MSIGQALDVRQAMFLARSKTTDGAVSIEERWYAPLHMPRILVHEIAFVASGEAVSVALDGSWVGGPTSADLKVAKYSTDPLVAGISGSNLMPELDGTPLTRIAVAASKPPESVVVPANDTLVVFNIQAFVTSLNSTDVEKDAMQSLHDANFSIASLQADHTSAWAERVRQGGGFEVEGDLWLAQSLNASLYFIRSSIRADWPFGLSPGGLASNGYGCVFCLT